MIEFRLLGPVEVRTEAGPIPMGPPRQRCVLAALAVDAGRPVQIDTIIDRVWGELPPDRARHALYVYIARIRGLLEQSAGPAAAQLTRASGGYVLDVKPEQVDACVFRSLVEQARDPRRSAGDCAALLRRALRLCRGTALTDVSSEWAARVREDWAQRRLDAAVWWAQAEVSNGNAAAMVGDLAELASEYPLAEPLVAALMRGLHAADRAAEALDRYTAIRRRLAEELGADPGRELQGVHQSILRGALGSPAATLAPRPGTSVPSLVVPAQLPLQIGAFTGRAGALAQLDQVLADPAGRPAAVVISAVFGTPGVGKTALAVHWAHRVAGQFPDGQLYVNLRGFDSSGPAMTPAEGLRGFLDALAVPPQRIPADLGAQAALFRSTLAGKRVLVVLDNARDAEQVRPLLPGTPGCLVLVTSRNQLTSLVAAEGAHAVALDLLTVEEARQLLAARIGAGRIAAEPEAVSEIIARCARLPLALAIIAARAAAHPGFPLAALTHELRNAQDGRDALDALDGGDAAMNVQAVFSWSYQTLGTDAARLFRLLGLHPGPDFATSAAASLAGIPVERARPLLAELIRVSLVTEHIPGRFSFHDLLRSYATGQAHALCTEDERRVAVHRMLDHYLHTAHTASMILNPARYLVALAPARPGVTVDGLAGYPQALAWFTAEHAVLEAAIGSVSDTEFAAWTWQLAWTLTNFLDRRGHWRELAQIQRTALAVAQRLGDLRGQAHARHSLALACSRLGHHDDACTHLQHALDLFGALGDRIGEAHTHWFCSHVAEQRARPLEALNHAQQALGLYRLAGHRAGHAATLNAVGWYHARLGNYRQALADCEQALDLQRDLGDRYNEASTWGSLGYAHHHLGNLQQAIDCYQHSLSLMRAVGYRHDEAELLLNLGDTHHAAGDTAPARDAWQQALEILDQLGHPNAGQIRARLHALDAQ